MEGLKRCGVAMLAMLERLELVGLVEMVGGGVSRLIRRWR